MKKLISFFLSFAVLVCLGVPAFAADSASGAASGKDVILEEYPLSNSDIVFTMDLFEQTYTRQDVANMIAVEKAKESPASNQYRTFTASESEIDEFYRNVEAIAARTPALTYYFSNVYWRFRSDDYYGPNTLSLTLRPTSVTRNNRDLEVTMASWALVKAECGSSRYWTNERSLEQQFRCHALGEIYYPGDVGDWDLEPIRPYGSLFEYAINMCNPTD